MVEFCVINRAHILLHSFLISIFLHHRISLLTLNLAQNGAVSQLLIQCLLFLTEIFLTLAWLSQLSFRWAPVDRSVFVDRLPADSHLPGLDVLVCTADPDKEPTVEVMNTVLSAMALDYPPDKLHVYLSDDGGSQVTLAAVKEAWAFATWWVPFCRRYEVKCRCPVAYFGGSSSVGGASDDGFTAQRSLLKEKYGEFKERLEKVLGRENDVKSRADHPPLVHVINEQSTDPSMINSNHVDVPLLVYVAREKRPSYHHHFKAGALNVLLRVSGVISNSPVVLVLDCDMQCNDPTSAKQAMCFFLDKYISSSLAFVQFPQRFRNVSKHDIYDTSLRICFKEIMLGLDGVGSRPMLCGTGFYMDRKAIYNNKKGVVDLEELRRNFGNSNDFLKTLKRPYAVNNGEISFESIQEAEFLASCVGFLYHSLLEDAFTGYSLHCRGWKSVYLNPKTDPFLGTTTTNLNDLLTQHSRWYAGCVEIGLSRFCPLVYGLRTCLPLMNSIYYTWVFLHPAGNVIMYWCLAIAPQLCLLHGIPLYPQVSSPMFVVLALIFLSSRLKHLEEVLRTEGTVVLWWNEQRMRVLKHLTCITYGTLEVILKILGLRETSFIPTNKVIDNEQENMYHQGIYDFRTSSMFLIPLGTVVILNLVCFVGGSARMLMVGNWDEMAAQVFISGFYLVLSLPIIEGMYVRKDKGRFATSATLSSTSICLVVVLGSFLLFKD
ncbi:hypothetical protein V2J09_015816 [Rumex salicifolius]